MDGSRNDQDNQASKRNLAQITFSVPGNIFYGLESAS